MNLPVTLKDVLSEYHAAVADFVALVSIEVRARFNIGLKDHVEDIAARILAADPTTPLTVQRDPQPAHAVARLVTELHGADPILFLGYPGRRLFALLLLGTGPHDSDSVAYHRANADRANVNDARRGAYLLISKLVASGKPLPEPVRVFVESGGSIAAAEAVMSKLPVKALISTSGRITGRSNGVEEDQGESPLSQL